MRDRTPADGVLCGEGAYSNMTSYLSRAIKLNESTTQEQVDYAMKTYAPLMYSNARQSISRNLTEDWPYTPYLMVAYKTTDRVLDTRVRQTKFGFYQETVLKVYEGKEKLERKNNFARASYYMSQNDFKSDTIVATALSRNFLFDLSNDLIKNDVSLVGLVILVNWLYLTFHMKSFFLSLASLINIFMSIPIGLVIYKMIFKVNYFTTYHLGIIFLILGVGCDDVFVFHDFWLETFRIKELK